MATANLNNPTVTEKPKKRQSMEEKESLLEI